MKKATSAQAVMKWIERADWRPPNRSSSHGQAAFIPGDMVSPVAMPQRTQITRHDCVEGRSAIGRWTGVPLHRIPEAAGVKGGARYTDLCCAHPTGAATSFDNLTLGPPAPPQNHL